LVPEETQLVLTVAAPKSSFLDKVLGRIGRLDKEGLQTVVQRLARERSFLETLFNTIEDGVLVVDELGRIVYFNQAVTRLLGLQTSTEGRHLDEILPELDWKKLNRQDEEGGKRYVRHEFEVAYPRPRFIRLYAAPLDGDASGSSGLALILHDATEARQQTFEAIESERVQALTLLAASRPAALLLRARVRKPCPRRLTRPTLLRNWISTYPLRKVKSTVLTISSRSSSRPSAPRHLKSSSLR
jgi:PAS domain S-box-containing protein